MPPSRSTSQRRFPGGSDPEAADFVDVALYRQAIERFEPQAGKELDAGFERLVGMPEGPALIGFGSFDDTGKVSNIKLWAPSVATRKTEFFARP